MRIVLRREFVTGAEWAGVRPLLPMPAWLQGHGRRPVSSSAPVTAVVSADEAANASDSSYQSIPSPKGID
ncbi:MULTISPECIES: hypothetical protein [unclassified Streptomyces]|uniref:hypothetical protein n=1 Tax=unclassified Streptomyces TaxID=2593676 RepID=UPI002E118176|nr:hypothetical protein OG533_26095 [Streptomyces sp. NBC_01186]WSS43814.1 hypothetical protein OG220_26910 [Streptomyces sp. NBC_01187]